MVALIPRRRRYSPVGAGGVRLVGQDPVRAGPRPAAAGRGTRIPSSTGVNCGLSPRCPAVTTIDSGFWPCSQARCSLRGQPAPGPAQRVIGGLGSLDRRRAVRPADRLSRGHRQRADAPGDRRVHAHVPADPPGRVGAGLHAVRICRQTPSRCQRRNSPYTAATARTRRHVPPRRPTRIRHRIPSMSCRFVHFGGRRRGWLGVRHVPRRRHKHPACREARRYQQLGGTAPACQAVMVCAPTLSSRRRPAWTRRAMCADDRRTLSIRH